MKTIPRFRPATKVAVMLMFLPLFMLASSFAFSQAKLVKDLNTAEYRHVNEYSQLTNAHGLFYFVNLRKELWKSDGNTLGTMRVKALHGIENLTLIGNTLYFAGKDQNGLELWKSDGTPEGTVIVKDIRAGISGSAPKQFTSLNGTIFFVANDGQGDELWKTDGTSTGTVLVKDIRTGISGSKPLYLTAMSDKLYFTAHDGKHGRELWRSDGTAAGTTMIKDIETQSGRSSEPQNPVALNGILYFTAHQPVSGRELWKTDGTTIGTVQLKDINPGTASSGITTICQMGSAIYFTATNGTSGTALWRSTGTSAGTAMLKSLESDQYQYEETEEMTVLNNRIYWLARSTSAISISGYILQIWVSNGTVAGTRLATTFEDRETPPRFTYMNNKIYYYSSTTSEERYGPFRQLNSINPDGTGQRVIWGMWTPIGVSEEFLYHNSTEILAFNNAIFFAGVRDDFEGYKLLKSDGSEIPPEVLVDTYTPTLSSLPNTMAHNNSHVYFATSDNNWDNEHLWRTDGTGAGTIRLKSNFGISNVNSLNNTIYFTLRTETDGWALWRTDGTIQGTTMVKEDNTYTFDPVISLVKAGNRLFFQSNQGNLWRSDGTAAGTVFLKKFPHIEHIAPFESSVYAIVRTASAGQELWKSNGTTAGTVRVKTIRSGEGPTSPNHLAAATMGNIFYFVGHDGIHGQELWRTDGTAAGTFMVKDIRPSENDGPGSDILRTTAFNNFLYINAEDINGQLSLFKSDGTGAGTQKIHESGRIFEFIPYNDQLLFLSPGSSGLNLWATDGTGAETILLRELPGAHEFFISHVELNDVIYLAYQNSTVIWRTDGTECGTFGIDVRLKDMNNLAPLGSSLLFSAKHDYYGNELFAFNTSNVVEPACPELFAARQETSTAKEEYETRRVMYTPNPFDRDLTVIINSDHQSTAEVVVHDMAGRPVTSEVLQTNTTHRLGSDWHEGIYIMHIYVDGKVTHQRIVKGRK